MTEDDLPRRADSDDPPYAVESALAGWRDDAAGTAAVLFAASRRPAAAVPARGTTTLKLRATPMTGDDRDITPDLLRRADWDDRRGVFSPQFREKDYWLTHVAGRWVFAGRACDPAEVTTMGDGVWMKTAAEATLTPLED